MLRQRWLARLPEVPGAPPLPVPIPRAHKSCSCVPGSHPQLRPLGLRQRRLAQGQKVRPQQTLCFSEGRVLRRGGGPAIRGTCLPLPCTLEERRGPGRPPEDTGLWRGPTATHDSVSATVPGDSDPGPRGRPPQTTPEPQPRGLRPHVCCWAGRGPGRRLLVQRGCLACPQHETEAVATGRKDDGKDVSPRVPTWGPRSLL